MSSGSRWRKLNFGERMCALGFCLTIAVVLALAAVLTPDERGLGTHEQLGLGSCQMIRVFGIPCMFCGMTTTFTLIMHGAILDGIINQPAGALIFLFSIISIVVVGVIGIGGNIPKWMGVHLLTGRIVIAAISVLTLGWLYKLFAQFVVT